LGSSSYFYPGMLAPKPKIATRTASQTACGGPTAVWHRFFTGKRGPFRERGKASAAGLSEDPFGRIVSVVTPMNRIDRTHISRKFKPYAVLSFCAILPFLSSTIPGCSSHHSMYCIDGQNCCADTADCYQNCGDGCNLMCAQTAHSCNSSCGNQCASACHDTNDCSLTCANNCSLDCYSTASCAGDCGANCNYSCTNTSRCDVRAGQASTVNCDHVATCRIQCTAACTVNYNSVDDIQVTCATGVQSSKGAGTITCSG